jgi:hypothetical protein
MQMVAVTLNNSRLLTFPVAIQQLETKCCIDTGASSVFVSQQLAEEILKKGGPARIRGVQEPIEVRLASGSTVRCSHLFDFEMKIEGELYPTTGYLMPQLPYPIILGMSFLTKYRFELNSTHLTLENKHYPAEEFILYTQHDQNFEPFTEQGLEVGCSHSVEGDFLVDNYQPLVERQTLGVGKGIVSVKPGQTTLIMMANLGKDPILLPKNTVVGTMKRFSESDWHICPTPPETFNLSDPSYLLCNEIKDSNPNLPEGLDLTDTNLTPAQLEILKGVISEYLDCFNKTGPATAIGVEHSIDIEGNPPVNSPPYRVSPRERETIEKQITEMLTKKHISPSKSPYASPVVLVRKKDNTARFAIDYRKLNEQTKRDRFPLPRIDDTLHALGGCVYFSSFDLAGDFHQIPVRKGDREKTAFITHKGLHEFNVMPFGLCNAPATFQRYMDLVFAGIKWVSCLVYIDDIIVFSRSFEQHIADLVEVFERLRSHNLTLKASKCFFCKPKLIFLGYEISPEGIRPNPGKISAIKNIPIPKNKKDLKSFLGIGGYYRNSIEDYAKLAAPLHRLTHDLSTFVWGPEEEASFNEIKQRLTTAPILAYPDFSQPFIIQTDACNIGISAILCQRIEGQEKVILYMSRGLTDSEKKWETRDHEALAIVWPYVIGTHFTVETDHRNLQWVLKAKGPARVVRWALRLSEFDFTIKYRSGTSNRNADGASRLPE